MRSGQSNKYCQANTVNLMPRLKPSLNIRKGQSTHRAPQQARTRERFEQILDATEELLETRFFEDISVQDIVKAAEVSTGSFYARFKSKNDVLRELYRRYREDLSQVDEQAVAEQTSDMTLSELIHFMVERGVERMENRRGLIRTIALHMRQTPDATSDRERATAKHARDVAVKILMRKRKEICHPKPEEAARLIVFTLAAACREFVLFNYTAHASQLRIRRSRFISEMAEMMRKFLMCPHE